MSRYGDTGLSSGRSWVRSPLEAFWLQPTVAWRPSGVLLVRSIRQSNSETARMGVIKVGKRAIKGKQIETGIC